MWVWSFFSYYRAKSVLETKIFEKFRQFYSGKSSLQEVFTMIKGKQDLGLFLVVGIPTTAIIAGGAFMGEFTVYHNI